MEKQVLQIESLSAEEIITRLDKIESLLTGIESKKPETAPDKKYMTRAEVAELFGITLVTVHQWTVNSILFAYRVGNRIYYKRSEIEAAYQRKTSRKHTNR